MNGIKRLVFGILGKRLQGSKRGRKTIKLTLDKRQKFIIAVIALSIVLFIAQFQFGTAGIFAPIALSLLTSFFLWWAIKADLKGNFNLRVFILPFFYSLAFGLFYFLVPARLLSRVLLTGLYAFGLYSLFLSQNIFVVGSIRTIALLSGARIVSFVITLVSFFFLSNIIFTFHLFIFPLFAIIFLYTYLLMYQSIWSYTLQKTFVSLPLWVLALTLCIIEVAVVLWFWPSNPTVIALFLTGLFYTIVGLSHVWFERRLFRGVLWEYLWVGVVVFFVLILFTSWGK